MLESYAEDERSCSSNSGNTVPWLCQKFPVEASTPVRINKTTCYVCDWSGALLRSFLSSLLRAANAFWVTWSVRRNALTEKAWEDAVQGLGKAFCMY